MVIGREVSGGASQQNDRQHRSTDGDMRAMETGQEEKETAVTTRIEGQTMFIIGIVVFNTLAGNKANEKTVPSISF